MLKKNAHDQYANEEELNIKFTAQLIRAINRRLLKLINYRATDKINQKSKNQTDIVHIEQFFEFLQSLETQNLIQKMDIFNQFADLFDLTSEDTLLPLFGMMENMMFQGDLLNLSKNSDSNQQQQ